jgi:hypothetical protein
MMAELKRDLAQEFAFEDAYSEMSDLKDFEVEFLEKYGTRSRGKTQKYNSLSKSGQGGVDDEFGDIVIKPPDA